MVKEITKQVETKIKTVVDQQVYGYCHNCSIRDKCKYFKPTYDKVLHNINVKYELIEGQIKNNSRRR